MASGPRLTHTGPMEIDFSVGSDRQPAPDLRIGERENKLLAALRASFALTAILSREPSRCGAPGWDSSLSPYQTPPPVESFWAGRTPIMNCPLPPKKHPDSEHAPQGLKVCPGKAK